jgi:hypothetical protein
MLGLLNDAISSPEDKKCQSRREYRTTTMNRLGFEKKIVAYFKVLSPNSLRDAEKTRDSIQLSLDTKVSNYVAMLSQSVSSEAGGRAATQKCPASYGTRRRIAMFTRSLHSFDLFEFIKHTP